MQNPPNTKKIDDQATLGLLGTNDSLAYRVHEIEQHIHSRERWYGLHPSVDPGVNHGSCSSIDPFVSVIGLVENWGAWITCLGTGDTPCSGSKTKFDVHRLIISDVNDNGGDPNKEVHFIQIAWGATGAAALIANDYTSVIALPEKDGKANPVDVRIPRVPVGTKVFVRHRVVDHATQADIVQCDMEFYIGLHEYEG
jgi:hypothetical protein